MKKADLQAIHQDGNYDDQSDAAGAEVIKDMLKKHLAKNKEETEHSGYMMDRSDPNITESLPHQSGGTLGIDVLPELQRPLPSDPKR